MVRGLPGHFAVSTSAFIFRIAQSRRSAVVKSFGRRRAYESPRRTNPRGAEQELWRFGIYLHAGERLNGAVMLWLDLDRGISGPIGRLRRLSLAGGRSVIAL